MKKVLALILVLTLVLMSATAFATDAEKTLRRNEIVRVGFTAAVAGFTWSPIKGPSGNIEFLAHLAPRQRQPMDMEALSAIIEETVAGAMEEFLRGRDCGATERENDR